MDVELIQKILDAVQDKFNTFVEESLALQFEGVPKSKMMDFVETVATFESIRLVSQIPDNKTLVDRLQKVMLLVGEQLVKAVAVQNMELTVKANKDLLN